MSDIPQTNQTPKRTFGQMATACETAAKRLDRKSMRESEANEVIACLERAAEFFRVAAPHTAPIAMFLGRPIP
jgi:hypothetical protein